LSFDVLCSVLGCGLFLGSYESYGKNLLYLKDQIKDLVITSNSAKLKIEVLKSTLQNHLNDLDTLNKEREEALEDNEHHILVSSIHKCLTEIINLEVNKKEKEAIGLLEEKYLKAEDELNHALNKLESLSSSPSSSSLEIIRFQSSFKESIIKWIDIINTNNISKRIDFIDGFKPNFGAEKLKQLSGSTHLRAVLSFHAALFEQIIEINKSGIRFLILDTPGQHDISVDDLDLYITALKSLADDYDVQIIFSTTRYKYKADKNDKTWTPAYEDNSFSQKMFLGYH
jgi:hypothetical protein